MLICVRSSTPLPSAPCKIYVRTYVWVRTRVRAPIHPLAPTCMCVYTPLHLVRTLLQLALVTVRTCTKGRSTHAHASSQHLCMRVCTSPCAIIWLAVYLYACDSLQVEKSIIRKSAELPSEVEAFTTKNENWSRLNILVEWEKCLALARRLISFDYY